MFMYFFVLRSEFPILFSDITIIPCSGLCWHLLLCCICNHMTYIVIIYSYFYMVSSLKHNLLYFAFSIRSRKAVKVLISLHKNNNFELWRPTLILKCLMKFALMHVHICVYCPLMNVHMCLCFWVHAYGRRKEKKHSLTSTCIIQEISFVCAFGKYTKMDWRNKFGVAKFQTVIFFWRWVIIISMHTLPE